MRPTTEQLATTIARVISTRLGNTAATVQQALCQEHVAFLCTQPVVLLDEGDVCVVLVRDAQRGHHWVFGSSAQSNDAWHQVAAMLQRWASQADPRRVYWGGPPECYLESGLLASETLAQQALSQLGFTALEPHVDLTAVPEPDFLPDPRVERATPAMMDPLRQWIQSEFGGAWDREVQHAMAVDGVFVARDATGALQGFCAHSGHNRALGTFGPLGVARSCRGTGLGILLARAALDALRKQGFSTVTIPWVEPGTVAFYQRVATSITAVPRAMMVWKRGG